MLKNKSLIVVANTAFSVVNFRHQLLLELVKKSVSITAATPGGEPYYEDFLRGLGVKAECFYLDNAGFNPLNDIRTLISLYKLFQREKPDVVYAYTAKCIIWATVAGFLAGVPRRVVMVAGLGFAFTPDANGRLGKKKFILSKVILLLYSLAFKLAHKIIVQNKDDEALIIDQCNVPSNKIVRINGSGVPLDEWPAHPPHLEPLTFTLVARILREKGVFEFLQAAQRVKARYPQVRFQLLGGLDSNPGSVSAADLRSWVEQGIVHWPGKVEVMPHLAETSVFVLPSYREGVPRSTQEAMAMGRPVISTDVPGCRETVLDGMNGFLVPPRNVDALVQAMERFIAEPALVARMGAESRRLAEERFDVRVANQIQMDVLLNTASTHTPKAA